MARLSVLVEFAKRSVTPAKTYLCDWKKKVTCRLLAASSQPIFGVCPLALAEIFGAASPMEG